MLFSDIIRFYSDKGIQEQLIASAKQREVVARYNDRVGARPDSISYPADIMDMVNKGATSFHYSVERWSNPLALIQEASKKDLDKLRIGWDLILDVDCKHVEYSKICAQLLVEALEFHSIKNYSVKFSGGTGFHIGVPFESFPNKINNREIAMEYPEGPRTIAFYLKQMIKNHLGERILDFESIKEISKRTGLKFDQLVTNNEFDPYKVLNIDTVAFSSRHLMRMPYSFNEKKWLVSVPLRKKDIESFTTKQAEFKNVRAELGFLTESRENEAKQLFMQSYDWFAKEQITNQIKELTEKYAIPQQAIPKQFFPPCVQLIYNGIDDGRKRAVFVLINFLKSCGWNHASVEGEVLEWNKKNPEPLSETYIKTQLKWHERLKDTYLPPNCSNANYYKDINICKPDNNCKNIKNPVVYPFIKLKGARKERNNG
jgi:DNA primase catalytic subunit